jgi:hypothetical protein
MEPDEEWFESVWYEGRRIPHVSRFSRKDFVVSAEVVEARWFSWTSEEKGRFASAFSERVELDDNDQRVLDFLMENGDARVYRAIAISAARHRDRGRAVDFLLTRVKERVRPLANYYQAIGSLLASECVPALREALSSHREEIALHPTLQIWDDRFIYLDYLSCAATLLTITGQEEYRAYLSEMRSHRDEVIRQMVRMVATQSNINLG